MKPCLVSMLVCEQTEDAEDLLCLSRLLPTFLQPETANIFSLFA